MWAGVVQKVCFCLSVLFGAILLAEMHLYSQNTLLRNGNWIVTKRTLAVAVMGADEVLLTRSPLAGNALNLGSWHGYQEFVFKPQVDAVRVEFDFNVPTGSYLDVIIEKTEAGSAGLRISRANDYPSVAFESDKNGWFVNTKPLPLAAISGGWHHATVLLSTDDASFRLDQSTAMTIEPKKSSLSRVGFRSGYLGARVDNFSIFDRKGEMFEDQFRNDKGRFLLIGRYCAMLSILALAAGLVLFFGLGWSSSRITKANLLFFTQLTACLLLFYAFDFYFWSEKPFNPGLRMLTDGSPVRQPPYEDIRFNFFQVLDETLSPNATMQELINALPASYRIFKGPVFCGSSEAPCLVGPVPKPVLRDKKNCFRFILLGTSQSIGAGAAKLEDSFFVKMHEGLKKRFAKKCVESLNLSISGSNIVELIGVMHEHLLFRPDLLVVNLATNDAVAGFESGLRQLAETSRKIGSKAVFVAEANSVDAPEREGLKYKHEIMKRVGAELGIETVSMHDFLKHEEIRKNGQLWWDFVHLTSFGHAVVADWLLANIPVDPDTNGGRR